MLSYANSKYFNILQMMLSYYSFAQNVKKCCIKILYRLRILVFYKTIHVIFKFNALVVKTRLKKLVWQNCFFLLFDNMNFQACIRDQWLHNKERQINYIAGYIYKINTNTAIDKTN